MAMERDEQGPDAKTPDEAARRIEQDAGADSSDQPSPALVTTPGAGAGSESCDVCGVPALVWRKCKLICENCGSVNKSCADL